ncbi:ATP-binding protein [Chloroflexota bacterium]
MLEYLNIETTKAEPEAASMIETFRAVGYNVGTAIADIIDNSISARASNIWVDYVWDGSDSKIFITDDGYGMNDAELIQAMKPGSKNPLDKRSPDDLGRFGLGLKTASFSQCRKFCVISKIKESGLVYWTWDLDYVGLSKGWNLLKFRPDGDILYETLNKLESGTSVIWWDIDRLTKGSSESDEVAKRRFFEDMEASKNHLGMVFHSFIENGLNIYFRDRKIVPWDPFMTGKPGIQTRPEMKLDDDQISIQGFILPHRSNLTPEEYEYGKGPQDSWTNHQGFYIYRNDRLLVPGDWLNMFKKEAHYDLCRIKLNMRNDFDREWHIDIKKSQAIPPPEYREKILALAKEARSFAVEVYRHRGKIIKRTLSKDEFIPVWEERVRHGKRFYKLNRKHPIIRNLLKESNELEKLIENAIKFIEETVPVPLIMIRENETDVIHGRPFEGLNHDPVLNVMKEMYIQMVNNGYSGEDAKAKIANIEPFDSYLEYIELLENNK